MTTAAPAMSTRRRIAFWGGSAAVLVLLLLVFSEILTPFVLGAALAYLLDPVADRLEKAGMSRMAASLAILGVFAAVLAVAAVILLPVLFEQGVRLVDAAPRYLERLEALGSDLRGRWLDDRLPASLGGAEGAIGSVARWFGSVAGTLFRSLWQSWTGIVGIVSLLFVTPVVAFYLLADWPRMTGTLRSLVPPRNAPTVEALARDVDRSISAYLRGQIAVCLILGTFYAAGLGLVGLNFGLLVGFAAGLVSFIPYVGSIAGLVLSLGLALVQFWPEWHMVAAVAAVFLAGQFVEGNILQPRLVGGSIGVHPVWLMLALFASGALFGFIGLLLAVPAAAALGVLVRFAAARYRESPFFTEGAPALPPPVPVPPPAAP